MLRAHREPLKQHLSMSTVPLKKRSHSSILHPQLTASMFSVWRNLKLNRSLISPSCIRTAFFSLRTGQTSALCSELDRRPCINPNRKSSGKRFNVPPSAEFVARVSGIPTMAKLPYQETADGLDAAFIGVPIDTGTSNRPGARWCFYSCC